MGILNLFPVAWTVARLGPGFDHLGEPLNLFCNFSAKVLPAATLLLHCCMPAVLVKPTAAHACMR